MIESIYFFIFENENGFRLMTDEGWELSETFQRSESKNTVEKINNMNMYYSH
jgi:hypothetical protein